ncbi:MAG: cell division protein ZapA [Gammaproteobacteria bacterium]|jgi:cell division protein ZapA
MAAPSISISILGRDYQIACPPEEEESLRKSARYLDQQMEQMRSRSASLGYEKIAVLAALNITHDMLKLSHEANNSETASLRDIKQLEKKIDTALKSALQIEI